MSMFKSSKKAASSRTVKAPSDYIRPASHSGSWYSNNEEALTQQLQGFLDDAVASHFSASSVATSSAAGTSCPSTHPREGGLQALIAPHAGLSYSGATAAYAYSHLGLADKTCVFVIGPSHHIFTKKMHISEAVELETPVGNLRVDQARCAALLATGLFDTMSAQVDEEEHSIEMHLPFVAHMMKQQMERPAADGSAGKRRDGSEDGSERDYSVVPIMIGHLSQQSMEAYAEALLPYFLDPSTLFVISSDFCHWGSRFRYQPYDEVKGHIHEYIEWLDKEAISLIESHNHAGFSEYLDQTDNTICGREAIKLLLALIGKSHKEYTTKCVRYAQSSPAMTMRDSSVSYASALVREMLIGGV